MSCNKETGFVNAPPALTTKVFNLGVSGNTAGDLLGRIDGVLKLKPDLVIVMIGTNDSGAGRGALDSYSEDLTQIINKIKSASGAVMLLTPPPLIAENTKKRQALLQGLRNQMDSIGKLNNSFFIDINKIFIQEAPSLDSVFNPGGIHPNKDGYKIIANAVYAYLTQANIKAMRIVCFGDSITYGVGSRQSYPVLLQSLLN